MRLFLQGAAILLAAGLANAAHAQGKTQKVIIEDDDPNAIMLVTIDKAGDEIVRVMNETQPQRFHDPKAPRFILTDRKGRFALGIGGYVKATAEYDFDGISDDVDFYPSLIPNKGQGTYARNQFQMDATTSTIFLKLVGRTKNLGDFVVYTAGNFRGGDKVFQLQNAYASFLGFTLGYDYTLFMDAAGAPPTIDFAGPNGMAFHRATQFRYEHTFMQRLKMGIAVEMPDVDGLTTSNERIGVQRTPSFPLYVQYNWNKSSHLRVAGIFRSMTYDNLVAHKAESEAGWGVLASTTFNLGKSLQMFGQGVYGRGISQYMNDISNLNVDIVPNPEKQGEMQVLPMMGWYAGLQYNITPKVFISSTYSQSRLYSEKDYPRTPSDQYRYGQYLVANVFWNITPNLQAGVEYLHGWRTDFDDMTRQANRINVSAQFNF
ncbi:DcaP family trimeric outer membrane transporter [Parabacteroides chinchillae]|uniref:Porin subfamily protein n=1 Tax=Parabacteroides chinchillae TaxID=871327 RepID=A0A8G2F381_9BACT|nr:DcaP family trimeric outer membrane transporter [Parabacteroides chinchillae]SEG02508.1 Porin subfamily protein [Parabacteroides chinchillae]